MRLSRLTLLLTACALAALAAPVSAQDAVPLASPAGPAAEEPAEPATVPIPAVWAPVPVDAAGQSAYGLYLSGLLASYRGDYTQGTDLLAQSHVLLLQALHALLHG
jgi:hypothetical protein